MFKLIKDKFEKPVLMVLSKDGWDKEEIDYLIDDMREDNIKESEIKRVVGSLNKFKE